MCLKCNFILLLALLSTQLGRAQEYLSPCDIDFSKDSEKIYITATCANKIVVVDRASQEVENEIALEAAPSGLCMADDSKSIYVTIGGYNGKVVKIDSKSLKIEEEIAVDHTPYSPVVSKDNSRLYVCNRFSNSVSAIDIKNGKLKEIAKIPVTREPTAADLTPDGRYLLVANLIPNGAANLDFITSNISVIDTRTFKVTAIPLINGAEGLRGLRVSPDGKYAYVTHLVARFLVPTTQIEHGWIATNAISIIDIESQSLMSTILLDDLDLGFANPWALEFSKDGQELIVSSAGNHEISIISLEGLKEKFASLQEKNIPLNDAAVYNDLSMLRGIRKRVTLEGKGPRALAVKDKKVYIAHYFSDGFEVVDFSDIDNIKQQYTPLGKEQALTAERQGEIYFHDASLCYQNWLSCTTCHPDARTDGMNWDLLNDGMGNPKNVKSMLLAHETPRAMSLGVRADAETAVRAGIYHIQFMSRPEEDALAIDAYLKSLKPEKSPYLVKGRLSKAAREGEEIFQRQGCIACHPAPLYTDLQMYNLGTTTGVDEGKALDTPTLVELWRTAPYLHDGRAATLHDALINHNKGDKRGITSRLSSDEVDSLVEYLKSL